MGVRYIYIAAERNTPKRRANFDFANQLSESSSREGSVNSWIHPETEKEKEKGNEMRHIF